MTSAQHIDNDHVNSLCEETPNLFLVNLLPSVNIIVITIIIISSSSIVIYYYTRYLKIRSMRNNRNYSCDGRINRFCLVRLSFFLNYFFTNGLHLHSFQNLYLCLLSIRRKL